MLEDKIITDYAVLTRIASRLRKSAKRIVFTNGCFDIIHYGHVKYLEEAARKADVLIVGVNSDSSVRRIKGNNRPLVCQRDRLRVVAALESVCFVVPFGQDTPLALIRMIRPHVLVKGADWKKKDIVGSEFVKSYGGKVETVRFVPGKSTTVLIKKIARLYNA
ncbi:MAG: D-glycero-beta-D-manno-heptose 1-phosphate adenylyltransferase [Candidatus Omnitrophota bacterium]